MLTINQTYEKKYPNGFAYLKIFVSTYSDGKTTITKKRALNDAEKEYYDSVLQHLLVHKESDPPDDDLFVISRKHKDKLVKEYFRIIQKC